MRGMIYTVTITNLRLETKEDGTSFDTAEAAVNHAARMNKWARSMGMYHLLFRADVVRQDIATVSA